MALWFVLNREVDAKRYVKIQCRIFRIGEKYVPIRKRHLFHLRTISIVDKTAGHYVSLSVISVAH
jgi:hypothetical protein